jgi:SagB-type dehydrogenase family enzyme
MLYERGAVPAAALTLRSLSRLLEYSLSLTAWKQAGETRWALRANPSSGNLHPTEGYLLVAGSAELGALPGLFHYAPREHALERRADCAPAFCERLMGDLPPRAFLLGLSSVYWREAWKYGERAFRYCQHDIGHAIGTVCIGAAALGWSALVLDGTADETIDALLGLDREADFAGAERESAELVIALWPGAGESTTSSLDADVVREMGAQRWYGKANRLSADHPEPWEAIERVGEASRKP